MLLHTFCFAQKHGTTLLKNLSSAHGKGHCQLFQLREPSAWCLERCPMYNICPNCSADLVLDVGQWPDMEAKGCQGGRHRCCCVFVFIFLPSISYRRCPCFIKSGVKQSNELVRSHSFGLCCVELEAIQITSQCSGFGLKEKLFFCE